MASVLQEWVQDLSFMQQTVLLTAVRGADGMEKRHSYKPLTKWLRRCVLISAMDGIVLQTPFEAGGGSFTGPSVRPPSGEELLYNWWELKYIYEMVDAFMDARDALPSHYYTHFMHAAEIIGYKHPHQHIREFWYGVYTRMVHAFHLWPESEAEMDRRLGDTMEGWMERNDPSSTCSD